MDRSLIGPIMEHLHYRLSADDDIIWNLMCAKKNKQNLFSMK